MKVTFHHDPPVAAQANPKKQKPGGPTEAIMASEANSCAIAVEG